MIRTKGEPGTGDIVQAVRHMRKMNSQIAQLVSMREDELFEAAKQLRVPYDLVVYVHENGKLPVVNFAAGGVATPADAALMMQLGAEGVFVGSGIFKSGNPAKRAAAIVQAVTNFTDVKRNAYGRQLGSFFTTKEVDGVGEVPMTFIRAPYVESVEDGVKVLAEVDGNIVGVEYGKQMGFAFHPELDGDLRIHQRFVDKI